MEKFNVTREIKHVISETRIGPILADCFTSRNARLPKAGVQGTGVLLTAVSTTPVVSLDLSDRAFSGVKQSASIGPNLVSFNVFLLLNGWICLQGVLI